MMTVCAFCIGFVAASVLFIASDIIDRRYVRPRVKWGELSERLSGEIRSSNERGLSPDVASVMILSAWRDEGFEIRKPRT